MFHYSLHVVVIIMHYTVESLNTGDFGTNIIILFSFSEVQSVFEVLNYRKTNFWDLKRLSFVKMCRRFYCIVVMTLGRAIMLFVCQHNHFCTHINVCIVHVHTHECMYCTMCT